MQGNTQRLRLMGAWMGRTLYSCSRAWTVALGSDMKDRSDMTASVLDLVKTGTGKGWGKMTERSVQ